jgi:toxin FitB
VIRYLLDTSILSELTKPRPAIKVKQWVDAHYLECGLPAIVLAELVRGVERLDPGKRRAELERALDDIREQYTDAILAFDEKVAVEWGKYLAQLERTGRMPGYQDSQIAATALSHDLTVATRNTAHFPGVNTVDPFAD